jgi:hypothetical protein
VTRLRQNLFFIAASLLLSVAVFGDSLWGKSIAAPVDHAPALWTHYKFVDPASDGIPDNHHIVDQLSYDLPLQWVMYHEWRTGNVPWWTPYTYGGRPLLADAHCNGTDPIRLLIYFTVPNFVLAYNWTLAAHHVFLGCGVFALLLHLRFAPVIAGGVALVTQVAGAFVLYIGHPWITATFAWYPWLWLVWASWWHHARVWTALCAPFCVAAIFYSGNLQSHACLPVFAGAFVAGYAGCNGRAWVRGITLTALSGFLGGLVAAPILGPELELFALNERLVEERSNSWLDGILALSGAWPWTLGTFRSIGYQNLGFHLFLGAPAFILALFGIGARLSDHPAQLRAKRTALLGLAALIVILTIPAFEKLFYARSAGFAVIGFAVLVAIGCERYLHDTGNVVRRWAMGVTIWTVALVVGTVLTVWILYPRLRPRIQAMMDTRLDLDGYQGRSKPLRDFQVENFPREVGFVNPEVSAAVLALSALAVVFFKNGPSQRRIAFVLALNLISPALFARRFFPRHPVILFERVVSGGAEQNQIARRLEPEQMRLLEGSRIFDRVFPQEMANFSRVHVVHGWAALQPRSQAWWPDKNPGNVADFTYGDDGELAALRSHGSARFQWLNTPPRPIGVRTLSLNKVELTFPAAEDAAEILRTDTRYPGWRASDDAGRSLAITSHGEMFSSIHVPGGTTRLLLEYSPSGMFIYLAASCLGLIGAIGCAFRFPFRNVSGDRPSTVPIVPRPS